MNGTESRDDIDRDLLWDCIYKYGPMEMDDLKKKLCSVYGRKFTANRIKQLAHNTITKDGKKTSVPHEWFSFICGIIYVAKGTGKRTRPMLEVELLQG